MCPWGGGSFLWRKGAGRYSSASEEPAMYCIRSRILKMQSSSLARPSTTSSAKAGRRGRRRSRSGARAAAAQSLDLGQLIHGGRPVLVQHEHGDILQLVVKLYHVPVLALEGEPVAGHRQTLHQLFDAHPGAVGVLHRQTAPHAPLDAGVELEEVGLRQTAVLDLLQHADHVGDAVHRHIPLAHPGGGLAAAVGQPTPMMPEEDRGRSSLPRSFFIALRRRRYTSRMAKAPSSTG